MATTKTPRKKEKTKRLDLKVGMKDFGPIAEGEIELKPLTVFIGPNNSGKSYAAMLIRSIYQSHAEELLSLIRHYTAENLLLINDSLKKAVLKLDEMINNLNLGDFLVIPKEIKQEVLNQFYGQLYEDILSDRIIRALPRS